MASVLSRAENIQGNIWVPPGHFRTGQEGDVLYTTGIGACMEITVYDVASRVGHMAHAFSTTGSQQEIFSRLGQALTGVDPSQLRAWITGSSSEARLVPSASLRSRAIARLDNLGLVPGCNLAVEWNNQEDRLLSASLDCDSGEHQLALRPVINVSTLS